MEVPEWIEGGFPWKLTLVPIISMIALAGANAVYSRVAPRPPASADTSRRTRTTAESFRLVNSLLDTGGNVVLPWQAAPAYAQQGNMEGWLNCGVVLIVLYVVSNAVHNHLTLGSLWRDGGAYIGDVLRWLPELGRDWLVLVFTYSACSYFFALLLARRWLHGRMTFLLQVALEVALMSACTYYGVLRRDEWPLTQRVAWLIESAVLIMKMHSYITVNRHLQWEVDSGGPGTGAIIFTLDAQQFQNARAAAAEREQTVLQQQAHNGKAAAAASAASPGAHPPAHRLSSSPSLSPAPPPSLPRVAADDAAHAHPPAASIAATGDSGATTGSSQLRRRRAGSVTSATPARLGAADSSTVSSGAGGASSAVPHAASTAWEEDAQAWTEGLDAAVTSNLLTASTGGAAQGGAAKPLDGGGLLSPQLRSPQAAFPASRSVTYLLPPTTDATADALPAPRVRDTAATAAADEPRASAAAPSLRTSSPTTLLGSAGDAVRDQFARHAALARRFLGTVIYGVNFEGCVTETDVVAYPANVNLKDFILFSCAPVLCYDPNFPRTQSIRIGYLLEKAFLAAGLLVAAIYMHTHYVLPVLARIHELDELDAASQLLIPITIMFLLFFFLVFEAIMNAFAELSYFGDRCFYHAWWSATTFMQWSREWNVPVHTWLLRHVYLDIMRQHGASPAVALHTTFLVSIVMHEWIIWGVFGAFVTPWLGLFSLLQLPLGSIQRIPLMKGKRLGNFVLWAGLTIGITLVTVLYSKEYCSKVPRMCVVAPAVSRAAGPTAAS